MMNKEIWKPIRGYTGIYEISNTGEVRSVDKNMCYNHTSYGKTRKMKYFKKGKMKSVRIKRNIKKNNKIVKYCIVDLWKNNKPKTLYVHRLVAKAFINNPNKYPIINHKDADGTNNNVENLEWCTYSYNNIDSNKRANITKRNKRMMNKNG